MKLRVFSLYDAKAKVFQTPFYMPTLGMALRAFDDLVNDESTLVNKHPGDFQLYEIAEYDDDNGKHKPTEPLDLVATAQEYKKDKRMKMSDLVGTIKKEDK